MRDRPVGLTRDIVKMCMSGEPGLMTQGALKANFQ